MKTGMIFDIQRASYVDGPGIRTTVFFKGCNLRCKWCHNPESQSAAPQMLFYKDKCTGCGKCREECPHQLISCDLCGRCTVYCPHSAREICGKEYTVDEIMRIVQRDKAYYGQSGGGITCSGGECMLQPDFLAAFLSSCNQDGIHTAVDTAGDVPWSSFEKVLPFTDLFLYDVKCVTESLHIAGTGCSNIRILENLQHLSDICGDRILIRVPVIPGYNDSIEEMAKIADFVKHVHCRGVELLPYHRMGEHKYDALGMTASVYDIPTSENMAIYRSMFEKV